MRCRLWQLGPFASEHWQGGARDSLCDIGNVMIRTDGVVIAAGVRVPQARQNSTLLNTLPLELSVLVAKEAIARSRIDPTRFGAVHWGLMYQTEGNSVHLAKHTAMGAGLPRTVPAALASRLCCSGLQAVIDATRAICLEEIDVALAGSVDCISRAASFKLKATRKLLVDCSQEDPVNASTLDEPTGRRMAELVDSFARDRGIKRVCLDDYAFHSRERTRIAQQSGLFHPEIVPISSSLLRNPSSQILALEQDQVESRWPRRAGLSKLESPYGSDGRITRGNVSAFADGAAAVVLADRSTAIRHGYPMLAVIRSWAVAGAAPDQVGDALISAILEALKRAQIGPQEISSFEIEEAFAVNCVFVEQSLKIPAHKINPTGGALGLGHSPASSGLRQLVSAVQGLQRSTQRYALIGVAAGGSQAIAIVIENTG